MEPRCFLIWNIRGLNDRAKRDSVKSLVLYIKPSIVCLQETKFCCILDFDILSILGSRFSNFFIAQLKGQGEGY
jgi:exonuclease III